MVRLIFFFGRRCFYEAVGSCLSRLQLSK